MHDPPRILIVDDNETNRDILDTRLKTQGYELIQAADGEAAIAAVKEFLPDLVLLDVMMPKLDGIEVCRRLKSDGNLPFIPIVLVTAKADTKDIVAGLQAGADEYLTKPVDQAALVARVRSMLRFKALHDQVQAQATELAGWNRTLEARVAEQLAEIERAQLLKRFLPPQVAELIAKGDTDALKSHRRDIVAVMCDLRGFTSFAETGEPEDVIALLHDYHSTVVPLVFSMRGRWSGSWEMAFWSSSTIRCFARILPAARSAWRSRCARRWPNCLDPGGSAARHRLRRRDSARIRDYRSDRV